MEEVDGILIYTLRQIGCDVSDKVSNVSPAQLMKSVSKCLKIAKPDLDISSYDESVSMSGRYKAASQLADALKDLGYKDEIGCQSFLYPNETETRKLLVFVVENMPRDDTEIGSNINMMLSKFAQSTKPVEEETPTNFASGKEVDGIRLPTAVDINALPKETLRFYASHLADLTFAQERAKYRQTNQPIRQLTVDSSQSDDDFGEDEDVEPAPLPIEKPVVKPKPALKVKKPPVAEKPKPQTKENSEKSEDKQAAEVAEKLKILEENAKFHALEIRGKEKRLREMDSQSSDVLEQLSAAKADLDQKRKKLDRLKKTNELLNESDDGLSKLKQAVDAQVAKILTLANTWDEHRRPLIDDIRKRRSHANSQPDVVNIKEEIRKLRKQMKEMAAEAKKKEEAYEHALADYEKMPKDVNRSSYTRRIIEIIGNIKKQKKEISKVLEDTRAIQKEINNLSGRIDRTFAVADEIIFKDAEKDKTVAQSYKLLVSIHSDFSKIMKTMEDISSLKRQGRDMEDKLDTERAKNVEDKLKRLQADVAQMKNENKIVEAQLRDPSLQRHI